MSSPTLLVANSLASLPLLSTVNTNPLVSPISIVLVSSNTVVLVFHVSLKLNLRQR
jgi:hypothetical protein